MTDFDELRELRELKREIEILNQEIMNEWEGFRVDYLMNKKYKLEERIRYLQHSKALLLSTTAL